MQDMDNEEFRAFEVMLAFIDECDDGINEFSDCSENSVHEVSAFPLQMIPMKGGCRLSTKSTTPINQVSADAQEIARMKGKLAIPGRNRSRDLQKLELLELRVEAAALQERVDDLRRARGTGATTNATPASRSGMVRRADVILLEACENLAKRQLMLRREAEHENENLRELVKGHVKTVKTLKRLFQRQNIDKIPRSAWLFNVRTHTNADNTFSVLQQLSGTLGDVFGDTDRVFRSNGLSVIRTPFSRQNTQLLSTSTAYIEILKCDLLPFDFRVLGKALMGGMATNLENSEEKYLQSQFQDSVVARATTAEVNGHIKIRYRLTGTNYHEQKREVIVVSGNHELLELFGEAVDSVCCQEKTWCVLTEESPGLCRLQLCMGITLQIPQLSKGTRPFFNRACEMLATLYQKMFESVTSGIEQALLAA